MMTTEYWDINPILRTGMKTVCPGCNGHGMLGLFWGTSTNPASTWECEVCSGRGSVVWPVPNLFSYVMGDNLCPVCGNPVRDNTEKECPACLELLEQFLFVDIKEEQ
jgi:hypothetical protein